MGILASDLLNYVVRPALIYADLHIGSAEQLIMGTAAVETAMGSFLHQVNKGPALGLYQIEPATHLDIYKNFLGTRAALENAIFEASGIDKTKTPSDSMLIYNLNYATLICRVKYMRCPKGLPNIDDVQGMAEYWKENYNTNQGAGSESLFIKAYLKYVQPLYQK